MLDLASRIGHPERSYPVIHVAGTKGKGSVCSILGSILTAAGIKTGVYSSPHLERVNQRIRINGTVISDASLIEALEKIEPHLQAVDTLAHQNQSKPLTFFEVVTATALQYFRDMECEFVILEVGMGGRLDSTNICQPEVCAITNISLDHTKQLGSTLDKIAFEKAGIIKKKVPVVCGETDPVPQDVIHQVAQSKNSIVTQLERDFQIQESELGKDYFRYSSHRQSFPIKNLDLKCGLPGTHQQKNAALAIAICEELIQKSCSIDKDHLLFGLEHVSLEGRCEIVNSSPRIILDMAHNEASAKALAELIQSFSLNSSQQKNRSLLFATSKDKDAERILDWLLPLFDQIIITKFQSNPRSKDPVAAERLANQIASRRGLDVRVSLEADPARAFSNLVRDAAPDDSICVAGSAFLVAEIRPLATNLTN